MRVPTNETGGAGGLATGFTSRIKLRWLEHSLGSGDSLFLGVTFDAPEIDREQYYGAGSLDYIRPSKDGEKPAKEGRYVVTGPSGDERTRLPGGWDWDVFRKAFLKAAEKLNRKKDAEALLADCLCDIDKGEYVWTREQLVDGRTGEKRMREKDGKKYPVDALVISEITEFPGDKAAPAAKGKAAAKAAAAAPANGDASMSDEAKAVLLDMVGFKGKVPVEFLKRSTAAKLDQAERQRIVKALNSDLDGTLAQADLAMQDGEISLA